MLTLWDYLFFLIICFICFMFGYGVGRDKKKASSKNQQRKIRHKKFYQKAGISSMKNIQDKFVLAVDSFHGSYIGKVIGIKTYPAHVAQVQILACYSYPKQYAEFFADKRVERTPYSYLAIKNFPIECIGEYVGDIPEYHKSIKNALYHALKKCRPVELHFLLKHCREEGYSCVG